MLEVLDETMTAEDAAAKAEKPVYLVRAKLRELVEAGLVERDGDTYLTTAAGRQKLE
jgi:DNA-binding IclR family transcriptional regulator